MAMSGEKVVPVLLNIFQHGCANTRMNRRLNANARYARNRVSIASTPAQQQNLINTLHHLNELSPDQRERTLMRMENMERLSPQMREAVRSSARQLDELPPERKRMWQRAFRDLRDMSPEQRQEVLHSPEFAGQFSAQERSIMANLLAVEPYRNPGPMGPAPLYGR